MAFYTDAQLTADENGTGRGPQRAAQYLRKLDTPERRDRAVSEAHTLVNLMGGIYSHKVSEAVDSLLRMIANGNESDEMYGERSARMARETDNAHRMAVRGF